MKVLSFFSRFTFICNIAFLLFIILGKLESGNPLPASPGEIMPIPFFKEVIVILGVSAILINLLMCITYSVIVIIGKTYLFQKWLAAINFVFLIFEFYFFFF